MRTLLAQAKEGFSDASADAGYQLWKEHEAFNAYLEQVLDPYEPLKWLIRAAEGGHIEAQYDLGRVYEKSEDVLQDYVLAHQWYNLAAAQGKTVAAVSRKILALSMTAETIADAQKRARDFSPFLPHLGPGKSP